ncbi:glycosyltransferase family 2 protein [Actinopolymorpha pittospori]|uniref:Glycosyltransferase involved in cell wall biosynthesis n=1 Tax=Actinopolymorpha pittospori TaxID=648752 RepID=A0A927RN47_9ACTN|nr:glycosyltransferase family 2 protein [Actinopolymorpha pittospori]MBE1609663.1 glycosyltransferase involved in cell wall biosynthesis [Actinopolymorpha pittospori]
MGVKVSVVVPIHNARSCLDACVESVLDQSMPPEDYEVLFVDDGSTDGTSRLLDDLADRHPRVRVIHNDPSGGPGRPRNNGVAAAEGDYVYFLDQDDRLAPPALERLEAMARRCDSDIVIGKVVGHGGRGVPKSMFAASRERADILADRLLGFMTPHKLFRTSFLRQHDLRFPEGPAWLEDHRMVVRAYLLAKTISVLADDVCCHWIRLPGRAHHSARRFDPIAYYQALREVLDIVDAHTEPGDERDQMYAYWYHAKMLRLLTGRAFLGRPLRPSRYRHYRQIRRLALERFSSGVDRFLPLSMRVRSRLLRAGAYGDIARLTAAEHGLTIAASLDAVRWTGAGLVVEASAHLVYADGAPVSFRRRGDRLLWEPPCALRTRLPDEAFDATALVRDSRLDVYLRCREDQGDYPLPTTSALVPEVGVREAIEGVDGSGTHLRMRASAHLDVWTAKLGRPLDAGTWDCFVRAETCGWGPQRRLGRANGPLADSSAPAETRTLDGDAVAAVATDEVAVVQPYWTALGNLSFRISRPSR